MTIFVNLTYIYDNKFFLHININILRFLILGIQSAYPPFHYVMCNCELKVKGVKLNESEEVHDMQQ